jgi:gliding motility-associated-like protein
MLRALVFLVLLAGAHLARSQCLLTWDTLSTPGYGGPGTTYEAGQTVEICLRVNTWNTASSNWFHGFEIQLGPGWDPASLTIVSMPPSCDGNGNWNLYPGITSSATGATYGPGFYYDSGSGGPLDGNPGNNFGDLNTCPVPHWVSFCFELSTWSEDACIEGADLSITLNTLGDGEAGSWSNPDCAGDPNIVFSGPVLTCCDRPLAELSNPLCFGEANGQITATGATVGPYTYNWSTGLSETLDGPSTITGLSAGLYTLVMTDGDGCTSTSEYELLDPEPIVIGLDSLEPVRCPGGSNGLLAVTASGGTGLGTFSYSLEGAAFAPVGFFGGLSAGSYTVTARDSNGCLADLEVLVIEDDLLEALVLNTIDNFCFQDSAGAVQAGASGGYPPYSYSLDGLAFDPAESLGGLPAGSYTLFVQDSDGCVVSTGFAIAEPELLVVDAGSYVAIPVGLGVELMPETNAASVASWLWSPSTGLSCTDCLNPLASPQLSTWYFVQVTDGNGCQALDSTFIEVIREPAVPNAFTPNGDGLNDLFVVRFPLMDEFSMRIYNRWGQEIFATNQFGVGWDGTFQGVEQEAGVYVYFFSGTSTEGAELSKSGTVTLVR